MTRPSTWRGLPPWPRHRPSVRPATLSLQFSGFQAAEARHSARTTVGTPHPESAVGTPPLDACWTLVGTASPDHVQNAKQLPGSLAWRVTAAPDVPWRLAGRV